MSIVNLRFRKGIGTPLTPEYSEPLDGRFYEEKRVRVVARICRHEWIGPPTPGWIFCPFCGGQLPLKKLRKQFKGT